MTKILYIQLGSGFKYPNKHVIEQLKIHFPGCEVTLFDAWQVLKRDYWCLFCNLFHMIKENILDQISGRKNLFKYRLHFLNTPYMFNRFSRLVSSQVEKGDYDFVFQTQSLCDSKNDKGIPFYIYTDHTNLNNINYPLIKHSEFLQSKKFIQLEKQAYENAKLIFVMSPNIKDSLINQYHINEHKIKLIYVGTNTPINQKVNRKKYGNKNILFVGKDWVRKGGPLLIEAFKIVQTSVPDAKLSIIGCHPNVKLKNCATYGEISLEQVAELYDQASVFCMPTLREPFGIVFLEAMFNRLPIVTNSIGATPYLIKSGYNGYLLNYDAREYANALIELITDPDKCERLGNNSYDIARKTYTWGHVGELLENYILESREPALTPVTG